MVFTDTPFESVVLAISIGVMDLLLLSLFNEIECEGAVVTREALCEMCAPSIGAQRPSVCRWAYVSYVLWSAWRGGWRAQPWWPVIGICGGEIPADAVT